VSGLSIENLQAKIGATNSAVRINIAAQFGASATCIAFHEKDKDKAQGVVALSEFRNRSIIDEN
jgi:pyrroline-5-carboxylate reductase